MTYEEWIEQHKPIKNEIALNASYDGTMFETYGEEVEFVKAQYPYTIWTLLDEDGHTWIAAGWHFVNRMGYFITEVPWTDEHLEIVLDEPRYEAVLNHGFGWAIRDTEQPEARAVCWVEEQLLNAGEIAEAIASALNQADLEPFNLSHEEDEEDTPTCDGCGRDEADCSADPCAAVIADRDEDESRCLTPGCTEDANDGEGFDGYCGSCADRREANNEGIES